MSEFSIEEKAERYDKAIEKAKKFYNNEECRVGMTPVDLEVIFPELKEFSDKEIKKWLIGYFQEYKSIGIIEEFGNGLKVTDVISWLEKQGEQKSVEDSLTLEEFENAFITKAKQYDIDLPNRSWDIYALCKELYSLKHKPKQGEQKSADKVEPKFKVGDWVVLTVGDLSATLQIANIDINKELYWFNDGSVLPFADEENLHLWTIKDANAGDVLYYNDDIIVIFKYFHDNSSFCSYCYIDGGVFFTSNGRTPVWWMNNVFYPANKEQRDYLFAKMEESGYEWDSNKKELKRL